MCPEARLLNQSLAKTQPGRACECKQQAEGDQENPLRTREQPPAPPRAPSTALGRAGLAGGRHYTCSTGIFGDRQQQAKEQRGNSLQRGADPGTLLCNKNAQTSGPHLQAPRTKPGASGHQGCHSGSVLLSQQHRKAHIGPLLKAWMQTHTSWACQHHTDCHPSYGTLLPEVCCHALAKHLSQSRGRGRWHFFSVGSERKQQSLNSAQDEELSSMCSNRCAH